MSKSQTKRLRPGLYEITTAEGVVWRIEDREVPAEYGGGWAWYATSDRGDYLDPMDRLKDAKAAIEAA
jgi:hypothetical protein